MTESAPRKSLASELQRRNVLKVGAAYAVVAWLLIQVAATVAPQLGLPEWAPRLITLLLMLGFPIALLLAWFLERTAEGLQVEPATTGTRRMVGLAILLVLFALGWAVRDARNRPEAAPDAVSGTPSSPGSNAVTAASVANGASAGAPGSGSAPASIAVLPFANLGGKAEDEYFSDGMTEELLNVLARNTKLQVAARTSVFQFKDQGGDVREIGRTLGVGHIVEGSVRRDGEQVRITAQLIRVSDGFHVWSESWDRELKGVFALQDEIAQRLAEQLGATLAGTDAPGFEVREAVDPQAYDDFLKARALYRERRNILQALQLFRAAVARDPKFASAWANLALACEVAAYHTTAMQQRVAGDRIACMREAAARAADLAPTAAITLHAQANLARAESQLLDADRLYRESIARDATYPDVREDLTELLTDVGHLREAEREGRELVQLEPTSALFWFRLAMIGMLRDDAALLDEVLARVASIDPRYFFGLTTAFRRALCHGRRDEARVAIEGAFAASPDAVASLLALNRWAQGDADSDDALSRQFLRSTFLADGLSLIAKRGEAELYFEVLFDPRDRDKRFDSFRHLVCPVAAPMLRDARAHQFLREAGFEAYWREKGWPPQCRPLGEGDFECSPAPFEPRPAAAAVAAIMPTWSNRP